MTPSRKENILEKVAALKKVEGRPGALQRAAYRLTKTQPYASASASLARGEKRVRRAAYKVTRRSDYARATARLRRGEAKLQRRISKSDTVAALSSAPNRAVNQAKSIAERFRKKLKTTSTPSKSVATKTQADRDRFFSAIVQLSKRTSN